MYLFREDINVQVNKSYIGRIVGLTQPTISKILNRKVTCRKVVAYSITKFFDKNAEIQDYFERVE